MLGAGCSLCRLSYATPKPLFCAFLLLLWVHRSMGRAGKGHNEWPWSPTWPHWRGVGPVFGLGESKPSLPILPPVRLPTSVTKSSKASMPWGCLTVGIFDHWTESVSWLRVKLGEEPFGGSFVYFCASSAEAVARLHRQGDGSLHNNFYLSFEIFVTYTPKI